MTADRSSLMFFDIDKLGHFAWSLQAVVESVTSWVGSTVLTIRRSFRRRKIASTIVLKVKETFYTFIHMYVSACFCVEPDTKLKNRIVMNFQR